MSPKYEKANKRKATVLVVGTACLLFWGRDAIDLVLNNRPVGSNPGVVLHRLAFGTFYREGGSLEYPRLERRFFLYDTENSTSPTLELTEAGPRAFRNGTQFMIGNYDLHTGKLLFRKKKWLEVQVRDAGSSTPFSPMQPRLLVSGDVPKLGIEYWKEVTSSPIFARLSDWAPFGGTEKFDPEKWNRPGKQTHREDMVADLMSRHDFYGKSTTEVAKLLGPPHSRKFPPYEMIYLIGDAIIDMTWLKFDIVDGHVVAARLFMD